MIIHAEAFGRGQDHAHGPPMLDGALENLQSLGHGAEYFAGKIFTADTNYHSDTNLRKCQELRLDAYIPDIYFRRRDPRYAAQRRYWSWRKRFALEDFHYEEATDHYLCPKGNRLRRKVKQTSREGMVHRIYAAEEKDCRCCPLQLRCITNKGGKRKYLRVPIGVELANLSKRMAGKVDSELGRLIYPQRFAVAEPVFANIRTHKRLDRFTLRGKIKVNIQWLVYREDNKLWLYLSENTKEDDHKGEINLKKKLLGATIPQKHSKLEKPPNPKRSTCHKLAFSTVTARSESYRFRGRNSISDLDMESFGVYDKFWTRAKPMHSNNS